MKNLNKTVTTFCALALFTFAFTSQASAQKYKTAADTTQLNKEYAEISLDISKLQVQLMEAKNKTAGYASKSVSTAQDATSSAQQSKTDAATATNGDLGDAKTALKQARKANSNAKDAQNAKDDQADNIKEINKLNDKIAKKQQKLADLDKQRVAILASLQSPAAQTLAAQTQSAQTPPAK